jgi:hypothetical protein
MPSIMRTLQGYDIGADEVWAYVYLPLVLREY